MKIAVIGSGPTGLMAAHQAAQSGAEVHVFEKRSAYGRKLLIAGSSGLNISHHTSLPDFVSHYEGFTPEFWTRLFEEFSPENWVKWIEENLKLETFVGTSHRYFVREMKASNLLKRWQELLITQGVKFYRNHELTHFNFEQGQFQLVFEGQSETFYFDRLALTLGGGSWEDVAPRWPEILRTKQINVYPFIARNVGYELAWKPEFIREAQGQPLKKIRFTSARGSKLGELMITEYGLEGTPVYFHGQPGPAWIDLKPDFTETEIKTKLLEGKENLSPIRRVKKRLGLTPAALALIFHHTPEAVKSNLDALVHQIKNFEVTLLRPRPLLEAISSSGGVDLNEVNFNLELKQFPGLYCGGEMLNWHSPTGGFLIQACVSQGVRIGKSITQA